ncbi:hypothetical protein XANCAGTX0491_005473 [Xanthoria calcicola]
MAEPLSFVASVVAVATLAETVVTKGYQYLKVVKESPQEVRSLMAEVNVLCGVLERLGKLVRETEIDTSAAPGDADKEDANSISSSVFDDLALPPVDTLGTPGFIYECQKTLDQIQGILHNFGDPTNLASRSYHEKLRFSVARLKTLKAKDLMWPMAKSKTLELIGRLERHKATCTIALASTGIAGVHSVLRQTELSNQYLADIRTKQDTMLKLQLSQEQEKALSWLSPVNPAQKHRAFARDRQDGTGMWLFDLPEMVHWLKSPNAGLWIYGIPGAGKTTLSTLVVDEILNRKRSNTIGTAYFYVRYDDKDSHNPSNVLGSLICQLACQNSDALEEFMDLHAQHHAWGSSVPPPPDDELLEKLRDLSRHFSDTFVMIDGLDECGSALDRDRTHLIDKVAKLNDVKAGSIRTLIFSREEYDIKEMLISQKFEAVSVAATSADLTLFANAWLGELNIRSERLRIEIVDTLVAEANGMFMWIRAQVDYLRRLPNDAEKRQALGKLPPDLPQTYIRILETIDRSYRGQTLQYIQRLLKWIFYATEDNNFPTRNRSRRGQSLSMEALCEAVCIEDKCVWPTKEVVPTKDQILRWLGCLVRVDQQMNELRFSHFSIKEFLRMDASTLSISVARNYLVLPEDRIYLINTCLTYIMHRYFDNVLCTSWDDVKALCSEHPFWEHVGYKLIYYILGHLTAEEDCGPSLRNFLATPPCPGYKLWAIYETYSSNVEIEDFDFPRSLILNLPSPLHFASASGLISQATRLLKEGTSPDATELSEGQCVTPLHLAINGGYRDCHTVLGGITISAKTVSDSECSLALTELLVQYGADVNRQMLWKTSSGNDDSVLTPLTLALLRRNWRVANYLLILGVDWESRSRIKVKEGLLDVCSLKGYMSPYFAHERWENELRELIELSGHRGLREAFAGWRYKRFRRDDDSQRMPSVQDLFISAFSSGRWDEVPKLINQHKSLNLDCVNENGIGAVYLAAICRDDMLSVLLEHQADPNLATGSDRTALHVAAQNGRVANIRLLLKKGAKLDPRQSEGYTPLLMAVEADQQQAVQIFPDTDQQQAVQVLLDAGADVNAKLNDGSGALHIALESKHAQLVTTLLDRGIECFTPNNFGTTPLNLACGLGLKEQVEQLIALSENVARDIDSDSVIHGTCLYTASWLGSTSIIEILLHHGAAINKVGPGNLLGSALMVACAHGHTEAVELLLANGAALEVEGSRFKSASGTARAFRQEKVLKILEHHARGMEGAKVEELGVEGQSSGLGEPKGGSTDDDESVERPPLTDVSDTSVAQTEISSRNANREMGP